ncbi:hypothetical protein JJB07_17345 [Tumebacillus sp. ITR2]|uniref:GapA-binding peptide SR1P n=1 Tax=Tumebacillus amylolyticus TaxID=2801339 RepID=A0ABS1JDK4_9BACL|nr:hypothetical protein [Tumebacillus amylolyticus]MBL0388373.1 hypothetical protein [Tumebacillus amylolyticus]
MANVCELCGRTEGELETGTEMSLDTLNVCEQCRQDRRSDEDGTGHW